MVRLTLNLTRKSVMDRLVIEETCCADTTISLSSLIFFILLYLLSERLNQLVSCLEKFSILLSWINFEGPSRIISDPDVLRMESSAVRCS